MELFLQGSADTIIFESLDIVPISFSKIRGNDTK
jgi:hypothetical protein